MENRVGFWPRVGAYVLDLAAVWVIGIALQRPLAVVFSGAVAAILAEAAARPDAEQMRPFLEWMARLGVAITLIAPFYALFEALRGWSPGKLVMRLRIATETGQKAPLASLFIRFAIKGAASMLALVALVANIKGLNVVAQAAGWATSVGCLLVLTKSRMALHDRIAGTAVWRKDDVVVAPLPAGGVAS